MPSRTKKIIAELGLRYLPSAQADLEAHAAALALLIRDVSHIRPDKLERAVDRWAKTQRFMPRACELIELAFKQDENPAEALRDQVREANDRLAAMGRHDVHWVVRDGRSALEWKEQPAAKQATA